MTSAYILVAALIGVVFTGFLAFVFLAPGGIPQVTIDEQIIPDASDASVVTGKVRYDVTLIFDDDSKKTFSQTVDISAIKLQDVSAGGKKLKEITVDAWATMKLPSKIDDSVTRTMYTESTAGVYLNGTNIGGRSFSNYYSFERLDNEVQLYHLSIPANSVKLVTGMYTLTVESAEQIRFVVDGQSRISKVTASSTFGLENDAGILKEIYVTNYSPAAVASLERDPITSSTGQVRAYNSHVDVKATGFKPFSKITFTYIDRSGGHASGSHASVLIVKGQAVHDADFAGSAVDETFIKGGYSKPDCWDYYAHFKVSDGENTAYGKSGCSWREGSGRGENPDFYKWP